MGRVNPSNAMKKRLLEANAYSCCVCKKTGIGLNFHHIDGNNSNTTDDNLAVLCVKEHDAHHRPNEYPALEHLDLSSLELMRYKQDWETFVSECKKENPRIIATINVFGSIDNIVGMKLVFQWVDGKIEFERIYQLLDSPFEDWIDNAISEVSRFGKNIKIALVDKPLPIEYCDECKNSISRTIDENMATMITSADWEKVALSTVYINPNQASLAICIFYNTQEPIYSVSIQKSNGKLHISDNKKDEFLYFSKRSSKRVQVVKLIKKILKTWNIHKTFIGTGDEDNPTIINNYDLPICWESNKLHTNRLP